MSEEYSPSFDRDPRGKLNSELGFVSIKNGTNSYLLEDEVNEMQWMQNELRAQMLRCMSKSGMLEKSDFEDTTLPGSLVTFDNLANTIGMKSCYSLLNGYIVNINQKPKENINYIKLSNPISDKRYIYENVYIEFWFNEIYYTKHTDPDIMENIKVNKNGYYGDDGEQVDYQLVDGRINVETSRRVQLQWTFRSNINIYDKELDVINYEIGFDKGIKAIGPSVYKLEDYTFEKSNADENIYVAGKGSKLCKEELNTIDGFIYAMPLFAIKRLNYDTYDVVNNPNGAPLYVSGATSNRPDGKFANIIYEDQVVDLRKESLINTDLVASKVDLDNLREELKNLQEELGSDLSSKVDSIIDALNRHNTHVEGKFKIVEDKILAIDAKSDNIISSINKHMNSLYIGQSNSNESISKILNKIDLLDIKINNVQKQLTSIGASADITQVKYGINMYSHTLMSAGSFLQPDGQLLIEGVTVSVPFASDYVAFIQSAIQHEGRFGEHWIEKGTSTFKFKNTGARGINCDTIIVEYDNTKMKKGENYFNGRDGVKISTPMLSDYIIIINPLESDNGSTGEYFITLQTDGFTVYNTGSKGCMFEWVIVDSNKLSNVEVVNLDLNSNNGVKSTGNYGEKFYTLASTPIIDQSSINNLNWGSIGDVSLVKANDSFTIYNTGSAVGQVRCLVFKEVKSISSDIYNMDMYIGTVYSNGTNGIRMDVPYYSVNGYGVYVVPDANYSTDQYGEFWINKSSSYVEIYNTGSEGLPLKVYAFKTSTDCEIGRANFSGNSTGTRVNIDGISDKLILVTSLNDASNTGEVYISNVNGSGFTVFNTGTSTSEFEYTILAKDSLENIEYNSINAPTTVNGVTNRYNGTYGDPNKFNVLISTPIVTDNYSSVKSGKLGKVSPTKYFDNYELKQFGGKNKYNMKFDTIVFKDTEKYSFAIQKCNLELKGSNTKSNYPECVGATMSVPFAGYNKYAVTVYKDDIAISDNIGRLWVEKSDNKFIVKNSGIDKISKVTASILKVDNDKVHTGYVTTGNDIAIKNKQYESCLVYAIPNCVTSLNENESYWVNIKEDSEDLTFEVINDININTEYDWVVIDTTKIRNSELVELELKGNMPVTYSGSNWGDFDVIIGTCNQPGAGMINVTTSFNSFSITNSGISDGSLKVKCLIIKRNS